MEKSYLKQLTRSQRQHYVELVCKMEDTMLPMQSVHRKNMQLLEKESMAKWIEQ